MAAIDVPMTLVKSTREGEGGRGPGQQAFVSEVWDNLVAMTFKPGAAKVSVAGRVFPMGYRYTGEVALWMGTLKGAVMHRGGETHAWASHPLIGKKVAWLEAQIQTPWGPGYANVTGWGHEGAMFGLVPHGLRLAWQGGQIDSESDARGLSGQVQIAGGAGFKYRLSLDAFEGDGENAPEGLWDGARITGGFSFVSAGLVRMSGAPVRSIDRSSGGLMQVHGSPGYVQGLLEGQAGVYWRAGETVVVRAVPECVSGAACGMGWSMIEPGLS